MRYKRKIVDLRVFYAFFFLLSFLVCAQSQTINTDFGKNRIQYHDDFDDWWMYESQNFITYWYGKARKVAETVVQLAEYDNDEIQNLLEHRINDKIQIIVYTDLTDLKQSNIGSEETFNTQTGQTKIVGRKVFVYFNGDHQHLRKQIRQGVASVYLDAMLEGANLQEIVQNAVMSNLPDWYREGIISFLGAEWDETIDDDFRSIFMSESRKFKKYKNFNRFARDYPRIAGHSFWHFMSVNYGKTTISNLLYLTRINRSLPSGIVYVLGTSFDNLLEEWKSFYEQRYAADFKLFDPIDQDGKIKLKNKKGQIISKVKMSPDGQSILYVVNDLGKAKVYLYDIENQRTELVFKTGFRNNVQQTDLDYPIIAWRGDGNEIAIMHEKRDVIYLLRYNLLEGVQIEDKLSPEYQRVYSMDYLNDIELVLSANIDGYSDLFIYDWKQRNSDRITNDFFDDMDVQIYRKDDFNGVLFVSNRNNELLIRQKLDTVMPVNDFDIFFLDMKEIPYTLNRLARTENINERMVVANDNKLLFISDQSGVLSRASASLENYISHNEKKITLNDGSEIQIHEDSTLASLDESQIEKTELIPIYNYRLSSFQYKHVRSNIQSIHAIPNQSEIIEIYKDEFARYNLYERSLKDETLTGARFTTYKQQFIQKDALVNKEIEKQQSNTSSAEDNSNYLFQTEFDDMEGTDLISTESDNNTIDIAYKIRDTKTVKKKEVHKFNSSRAIAYRLKFRVDYFNTNMDNSLLFQGLDTYAGTKQEFNYPPAGILVKANIKDLFEDHVIEGGGRFPTTFNGSEYFLFYDNKKKRIDKRFAVYRRSLRQTEDFGIFSDTRSKTTTALGQIQLRYPFDVYTSVRLSGTFRTDKYLLLSTDQVSLNTPDLDEQRLGLKGEFIYDNTIDVDFNIKNGTRLKFYAEALKKFNISLNDNFRFELNEGFMTVLGIDARHYIKIAKHSVLAARVAAATTFGSERIIFFLGDVENNLFPRFNNDVPFPAQDNFAFSTIAANLRGFNLNSRNGATFALANVELRVPIFKYLFNRRIRSSFIRNFQLVGFGDLGSAWFGSSPNSPENPINTIEFENPPTVNVRVKFFRDPFIYSYGAGVRTLLFGYFIKLDYAWGVETRTVMQPKLHLSLGVDF